MTTQFRSSLFLVAGLAMFGGAVSVTAQSGAVGGTIASPVVGAKVDPPLENAAQQDAATPAMQPGDSHVRIVRLSEMRGEVKMDRLTGKGFEPTMQNMPIVEGMRLETKAGTAEVEFEDGSTLRAAPDTVIAFPQLVRKASGETASTVTLVKGLMYVIFDGGKGGLSPRGTKGGSFTVKAGEREMSMAPGTHLRLEMSGPKMIVGVFKGSAEVQTANGKTVVEKKQTLTLSGDVGDVELAKKIEKGPFDAWDKQANEYHEQNMRGNALLASGGGSAYGISDLNYYGNFVNLGGCGQVWQPYFTTAAWSPYASGLWAYYPGAGYSFVSPYPWGWLPYHSGQWVSCGGAGWGWRPGGSFLGLNNIAGLSGATGIGTRPGSTTGSTHAPGVLRPPLPPGPSRPSLVLTPSSKAIVASGVREDGFIFQSNSAGLGVPRGQLGNLNHISRDVQRQGTMAMPVDAQSMVRGAGANGAGGGARGEFARSQVNLRPAGSPEVRGANGGMGAGPGNGGGNPGGPYRGGGSNNANNNDGARGQRGQGPGPNSGNMPQRSSPPPQSQGSGGMGGGGGMRGGGGGMGSAPAPSAPAPSPGAAPAGGRPR